MVADKASKPGVSVLVPVYNVEEHLSKMAKDRFKKAGK